MIQSARPLISIWVLLSSLGSNRGIERAIQLKWQHITETYFNTLPWLLRWSSQKQLASDTGHHKKCPGECKWNCEKIYTTASANIGRLKWLKIMIVTKPKCLQCHAEHSHQPANHWEASPNSLQAAPRPSAYNNTLNSFTQQGSPMSLLACTPSRFQWHTKLQTSLTYKPTIHSHTTISKPTVL